MTTLENKSPESIALILFSDDPKPENSIQLELKIVILHLSLKY